MFNLYMAKRENNSEHNVYQNCKLSFNMKKIYIILAILITLNTAKLFCRLKCLGCYMAEYPKAVYTKKS